MTTGELSLGSESVAFTKGMLAPLVEIGTWRRISEKVIGYVRLGEVDLRPSSRHAIRRSIVRGVVLTAAVVGLAALPSLWWDLGWWPPTLLGVVGVVSAVLYGQARYRALGWAVDGEYLLVRRGVFDRRLAIVPIGKVQDVLVTETFFQRRLGLATVEVDTAGVAIPGSSLSSGVKAIDLTRDDARSLADHLMAAAARIALPDGV
jgi:putative membrane protein